MNSQNTDQYSHLNAKTLKELNYIGWGIVVALASIAIGIAGSLVVKDHGETPEEKKDTHGKWTLRETSKTSHAPGLHRQ